MKLSNTIKNLQIRIEPTTVYTAYKHVKDNRQYFVDI